MADVYEHDWKSHKETRLHELGHAMTNNQHLITPYADELLKRSKTLEDRSGVSFKEWKNDYTGELDDKSRKAYRKWKNTKTGNYLTDPAEVYVRYKAAQKYLNEQGLFDHTTGEEFTEEDYNRINEWRNSTEFQKAPNDVQEFFGDDDWGVEYNKRIE